MTARNKTAERAVDLDLTPFIGDRIAIAAGELEFTLPPDLPLPLLIELNSALAVLGKAANGDDIDRAKVNEADDRMWAALDEVLGLAEPVIATPARELFTPTAGIRLLSFLVDRLATALT